MVITLFLTTVYFFIMISKRAFGEHSRQAFAVVCQMPIEFIGKIWSTHIHNSVKLWVIIELPNCIGTSAFASVLSSAYSLATEESATFVPVACRNNLLIITGKQQSRSRYVFRHTQGLSNCCRVMYWWVPSNAVRQVD